MSADLSRMEEEDRPAPARQWIARLASTIAAWLAAFLVVMAILSVGGHRLASQPLAIRALVISGVVVTVMTTLVIPALSLAVGRWLPGPTRKRSPGAM